MSVQQRLQQFCLRLGSLTLAAGLLLCLPEPPSSEVVHVKNALVAFGFIVMVGMLLFDTFFYDRL